MGDLCGNGLILMGWSWIWRIFDFWFFFLVFAGEWGKGEGRWLRWVESLCFWYFSFWMRRNSKMLFTSRVLFFFSFALFLCFWIFVCCEMWEIEELLILFGLGDLKCWGICGLSGKFSWIGWFVANCVCEWFFFCLYMYGISDSVKWREFMICDGDGCGFCLVV